MTFRFGFALSLAASLWLIGCSNSPRTYFLGQWTGSFIASETTTKFALDQYRLRGYLQLYRTQDSFKLHLEGQQQTLDITGSWELKQGPDRVVLSSNEIVIDDFGGTDKRDPNKPYLSEDKLRETFRTPISLRLSADRKQLETLDLQLDTATFRGTFDRQGSGQ